MKLELGDTQTLARQENGVWVLNDPIPDYSEELVKCQTSIADANDTYANKTDIVGLVDTSSLTNDNDHYPTSALVKSITDAKAPLASPALTGTPTAPTATAGTDTTQIATTAFVKSAISSAASSTTPVYGKGINMLDNWYFVGGGSQQGGHQLPINQRGQTTYTGSSTFWSIDRWKSRSGSTVIL